MMSRPTLTAHCQWADENVMERTGHPPSYAEAKNMKSLTLYTHGCPRASLRDCSSLFLLFFYNVAFLVPIRGCLLCMQQIYRSKALCSVKKNGWKVCMSGAKQSLAGIFAPFALCFKTVVCPNIQRV